MIFGDVIIVILLSLVLTGVVTYELKRSGTYKPGVIFLFFLLILLGIWAGGVWIVPIGPPIMGVYWVSFTAVGIFLTILIMSMLSRDRRKREAISDMDQAEGESIAVLSMDIFLAFLIAYLAVAIIAHYFLK